MPAAPTKSGPRPNRLSLRGWESTVVQGVASDAFGFVGNATVTLHVWPSDSVDKTLNPGEVVPKTAVGSATTDSTGNYAISITNWAAILAAADRNNIVNVELLAFTPDATSEAAYFAFPRQVVTQTDGSLALADSDPDGDGGGVHLTPQQANLSLEYSHRTPGVPCGLENLLADLGGKLGIVGAGFSKLNPAQPNINFEYHSGQTSHLGAAVQASNGSWHVHAGVHWDETSTDDQGWGDPHHDSTYFKTTFDYGKFIVDCDQHHHVHSRIWEAGSSSTGATSGEFTIDFPNLHCVHEDPNAPFTKKHTTQFDFTAGINISGDIGIDLSAQTSWSTSGHSTSPHEGSGCAAKTIPPAQNPKKLQFIPVA